jgi:hypothetical protein
MSSAAAVLDTPESTTASVPILIHEPISDEPFEISKEDDSSPSEIVIGPRERREESGWRGLETQIGTSSSGSLEIELEGGFRFSQKHSILRPDVTQEARQWLNGDLDIINRRVIHLCVEQARRMHVPIEKLQVSVKRSWEGEFNELVLQAFVKANLPQSLALWDAIGDSVQNWGKKQPVRRRRLLEEKYAVFVEPLNLS